jgi:hypothetical protein
MDYTPFLERHDFQATTALPMLSPRRTRGPRSPARANAQHFLPIRVDTLEVMVMHLEPMTGHT